jgi:gliding motility-associated-like protein
LDCALTPGEEYYCEMYVSLAEGTNYAQNLLGMYFSDTLVYVNSTNMLSFTPQVVETTVLKDTVNWVKISGNFVANSAHRYLIIGCFATAAQMQLTYIGPKSEVDFPYYYIDDVLVRIANPPGIQWTGDTSICLGDTLKLTVANTNTGSIRWYNNGNFIGNGNTLVYRPENLMNLSVQVKTCQWEMTKEIDIILFPPPNVFLGKDTLMCSGSTFTLDAGVGYIKYLWQDGNTSRWYSVSSPGIYSVFVENGNGCKGEDKIRIRQYKLPSVDLGENSITCKPEGVLKVTSDQPYDTYLWQDNSINPEFHFTSEGTYWVQVKNVCGDSNSDTIEIIRIDMRIPNLITPNGDGKNETLEIIGVEEGKGELYLYNRYGAIVYSHKQYHNDWNGADLADDIYYFLFDYPTCTPKKGWLQILR